MKKIPYAVGNFEQIQEQGFYYVDKTFYISVLEEWNAPVFLRPRRFGKSLWCSTLECYYDIKRKDKFNSLFGKTWIGQNPTQFKNAFMVLRFNFSEVSVKPDTAFIEKSFNFTQGASFDLFLHDYADYLTDYLGAVTNLPEIPLRDRLKKILSLVKARNLPPLYIIIDEYDNFTNQLITTRNDDLYKKLTTGDSFLRSFFKVIKSGIEQQSIGKVFITGGVAHYH